MPISAKLGVGAVASCLIHFLKPRERAQAQFSQEYALGRVENLLVESFLPLVVGKPAVCTVRYRGADANADPTLNVYAISCGSLKVTTPAAQGERIEVAACMRTQVPFSFFSDFNRFVLDLPRCLGEVQQALCALPEWMKMSGCTMQMTRATLMTLRMRL